MKKTILYIILILLYSCKDVTVTNLNKRITFLEKENDSLKKICNENIKSKLKASNLYLQPITPYFEPGKTITVEGIISEIQDYPEFEVYLMDEDGNYSLEDKIEIRKKDKNKIIFDYTPPKNTDGKLNVGFVFKLKDHVNTKITLCGFTELPVKKK